MVDFLLALSPSLILGAMSVLLVVPGGDDRQRILGLTTGGFLALLIVAPFLGVTWTPQSFAIACVSGLLLGWGLFNQTVCLRVLEALRTIPMSTGPQFVLMSLGGASLFDEWRQGASSLFDTGTIATLAPEVQLASRHERSESANGLDRPRGICLLATSTVGLVAYLLLVQRFGTDGRAALLPQAFGYMTVVLILTASRFTPWDNPTSTRRSARILRQMIPDTMWGCVILILQISADHVGVATGFALSQLGILVSTPAEIFLLEGSRTREEIRWVILRMALVICGAVLTGFVKGLDPV